MQRSPSACWTLYVELGPLALNVLTRRQRSNDHERRPATIPILPDHFLPVALWRLRPSMLPSPSKSLNERE